MAFSITSANSSIVLGVYNLFPVAQIIQGYAVDDVVATEDLETKELAMGLDGLLSAGWVPKAIPVDFTLQANSPSIPFFDAWYAAEQQLQDSYQGFGQITFKSIGATWTLNNGFLTGYRAFPDAKRMLEARRFRVTYENVTKFGI